jgi:aminobenzoyl-glutamate transport protein
VTLLALVGATMLVDLLVGSASAKWALLAPVFVPMLMQLGLAPELTQTAYRVGDSVTNIVTPLMPYFPLIVVYCQRYVRGAGIGTVLSMMIPYSLVLTTTWVGWLLLYWALGLPLGLGGAYHYP